MNSFAQLPVEGIYTFCVAYAAKILMYVAILIWIKSSPMHIISVAVAVA